MAAAHALASEVSVARRVIEVITNHARAAFPHECCGLLIGADGAVEEALPARNLRASPSRFLVDPQDHLAAVRLARATRRAVVGVYHSHPRSAAVPSPRDVRECHYTEFIYLICGPVGQEGDPPVRGWRLGPDSVSEIPLVVTEGGSPEPWR